MMNLLRSEESSTAAPDCIAIQIWEEDDKFKTFH